MTPELKAVINYESARRLVKLCTDLIGDALEASCTNPTQHSFSDEHCIDRLYQHNKDARDAADADVDLDGGLGDPPTLCDRCKLVDQRIQERKAARLSFGTSKRAISLVARKHLDGGAA